MRQRVYFNFFSLFKYNLHSVRYKKLCETLRFYYTDIRRESRNEHYPVMSFFWASPGAVEKITVSLSTIVQWRCGVSNVHHPIMQKKTKRYTHAELDQRRDSCVETYFFSCCRCYCRYSCRRPYSFRRHIDS